MLKHLAAHLLQDLGRQFPAVLNMGARTYPGTEDITVVSARCLLAGAKFSEVLGA